MIKLSTREGVEQEIGRVGEVEFSAEQGKDWDISERGPETEVRSGHRPCLQVLDQNTINRPCDRQDGVVKAGTGKWKRVVRQQGGELMNIQEQEHEMLLTCGSKRGTQHHNLEQDTHIEKWSDKRQKGLNKENEQHKMQVEVANLEWPQVDQ